MPSLNYCASACKATTSLDDTSIMTMANDFPMVGEVVAPL